MEHFCRSLILERGQSFREQSSRRPTPSEGPPVSDIAKTLPASGGDLTSSARDFEKRLQYAMQQSLVLQERQLQDIEILQEELAQEATGMSNRVIVPNEKAVIGKIRKPLKGILKKSIVRYVKVHVIMSQCNPVYLKTRKRTGTSCEMVINFSSQTSKFLIKYNLLRFQISGRLVIVFTKHGY